MYANRNANRMRIAMHTTHMRIAMHKRTYIHTDKEQCSHSSATSTSVSENFKECAQFSSSKSSFLVPTASKSVEIGVDFDE